MTTHLISGKYTMKSGFTLIEMSIVLVIIGLIAGGILTGRDLIDAASTRSQISQIERYNTAIHTFQNKYGGLPGDLNSSLASQFGFVTRAGSQGRGDGNGLIEGWCYNCGGGSYQNYELGELSFFWEDLSGANLIDSTFNAATDALMGIPNVTLTSSPSVMQWIPKAKIGNGNFVYVYVYNGVNYYAIDAVTMIANWGNLTATRGLTVIQAYSIDKKIDDGTPQNGMVIARFNGGWASGGGVNGPSDTSATPASPTTCYDNNGSGGTTQQYSVTQNNEVGLNCSLSFRLQ